MVDSQPVPSSTCDEEEHDGSLGTGSLSTCHEGEKGSGRCQAQQEVHGENHPQSKIQLKKKNQNGIF